MKKNILILSFSFLVTILTAQESAKQIFSSPVVLHRLVDFKVNYFSLYFNISYGVFPLKEP